MTRTKRTQTKTTIGKAVAVAATSAALLGLGSGPAASVARTESERYIGPGFVVAADLGLTGPLLVCGGAFQQMTGANWDGACFTPQPGDSHIDVTITDDLAPVVAGRYTFQLSSTSTIEGYFCGSVSGVAIPAGTLSINVYPVTQVAGGPCPSDTTPSSGVVQVDFS